MAYENLKLAVAALSGEIYLYRELKGGRMSDHRRIATGDCLAASTEWFMVNKTDYIQFDHVFKESSPTLFYTDDPEKIERIRAIIEEGRG